MASLPRLPSKTRQEEEEDERSYQRYNDLMSTLPVDHRSPNLRQFQGFWFSDFFLPGIMATREHFLARSSDIFLASYPKSGTTWLRSMVFSVMQRRRHHPNDDNHPLRYASPHDLVYLFEDVYRWRKNPDLTSIPSPRIFATHVPYSVLPESVNNSGCRIIYVARDPKDTFVSLRHFTEGLKHVHGRAVPTQDFDLFCSGISFKGPIWNHVLQYWNEHLKHPDKVMFLKYENMKEDPVGILKKLAAFLGYPFSADEEKQRVPESISELCSFTNLSILDVNKDGVTALSAVQKRLFFRRGEVGDWVNHMSPEMAEKLDRITHEKLQGSGLSF